MRGLLERVSQIDRSCVDRLLIEKKFYIMLSCDGYNEMIRNLDLSGTFRVVI